MWPIGVYKTAGDNHKSASVELVVEATSMHDGVTICNYQNLGKPGEGVFAPHHLTETYEMCKTLFELTSYVP